MKVVLKRSGYDPENPIKDPTLDIPKNIAGNISFPDSADAIRARTKTVTRRTGWIDLNPGDVLAAWERIRGVKKRDRVFLAAIEIVDVRREPLNRMEEKETRFDPRGSGISAEFYTDYVAEELIKEGHLGITPQEFVDRFVDLTGIVPKMEITRIEFRYLD